MLRRYGSGPPRWVQAGRLAGAVVLQDVPQALWMPAAVIAIASRPSMPGTVSVRGFEVGVHTYNHVKWQDSVAGATEPWTRRELILARIQMLGRGGT